MMRSTRPHPPSSRAAASAGQARDDDAEEGDDGVDDCSAGSTDGGDDGHEAVAYGAEYGLDLDAMLARVEGREEGVKRTQDTTAPILIVVESSGYE